jgi:hypothetical protein
MKPIDEMTIQELEEERDNLWGLLYMVRETSTFDMLKYNGLDFWDADRRYHKVCSTLVIKQMDSIN